jgi:hypothetical protein
MVALALAAGLTPIAAASAAPVHSSASALAPYCGITWGSQEKAADNGATTPMLTNIRAGRQNCYDRLVFDVRGGNVNQYRVQYVTTMTGTGGWVVPLRGGAKLSIMLFAGDYDIGGVPTYKCTNCADVVNVSDYPTFRQVTWAGSYRNSTLVGLGVRARLPFRVFTLPGRLVIDVAHHW